MNSNPSGPISDYRCHVASFTGTLVKRFGELELLDESCKICKKPSKTSNSKINTIIANLHKEGITPANRIVSFFALVIGFSNLMSRQQGSCPIPQCLDIDSLRKALINDFKMIARDSFCLNLLSISEVTRDTFDKPLEYNDVQFDKLTKEYNARIEFIKKNEISKKDTFELGALSLAILLQIFYFITASRDEIKLNSTGVNLEKFFERIDFLLQDIFSRELVLYVFIFYHWPFDMILPVRYIYTIRKDFIEFPDDSKIPEDDSKRENYKKIINDYINTSPSEWYNRGFAKFQIILTCAAQCDKIYEYKKEILDILSMVDYSKKRNRLALSIQYYGMNDSQEITESLDVDKIINFMKKLSSSNVEEIDQIKYKLEKITKYPIIRTEINKLLLDKDIRDILKVFYCVNDDFEKCLSFKYHRSGSTSLIFKTITEQEKKHALKILKPSNRFNPKITTKSLSYKKTYGKGSVLQIESCGLFYINMKFYEGDTLYEYIINKSFSIKHNSEIDNLNYYKSTVMLIFKAICDQILEVHEQNKCHRDISLDNIIIESNIQTKDISNDGKDEIRVKIVDYGANYILDNITQVKTLERLQVHIAPEVVIDPDLADPDSNDSQNEKDKKLLSDYYSLAIILLEILFRRCAKNKLDVAEMLDSVWHKFPDVAECIEILIDKHIHNRFYIYKAVKMYNQKTIVSYLQTCLGVSITDYVEKIRNYKKTKGRLGPVKFVIELSGFIFSLCGKFKELYYNTKQLLSKDSENKPILLRSMYFNFFSLLNAFIFSFATLFFLIILYKIFSDIVTNKATTKNLLSIFSTFIASFNSKFPFNIFFDLYNFISAYLSSLLDSICSYIQHACVLISHSWVWRIIAIVFNTTVGFIFDEGFDFLWANQNPSEWKVNLSAAVVGFTFACSVYAYYKIILSNISILGNVGCILKNIKTNKERYSPIYLVYFTILEFLLRFIPVLAFYFIYTGMFIIPHSWAWCSAMGCFVVATNNYVNYKVLSKMTLVYDRCFSIPQTGEIQKRFYDFKQWFGLMFYYGFVLYLGDIFFHINIIQDWLMYALLIFIVNILKMYKGNCVADGPYIKAFILRCYKAYIRSMYLYDKAPVYDSWNNYKTQLFNWKVFFNRKKGMQ